MQRITEPELMDDPAQATAYAAADFEAAHTLITDGFADCFPGIEPVGHVLDLGCGPGDISFRFAGRFPNCNVTGVDGAPAMIALANRRKLREAGLGQRVRFIEGTIPGAAIPETSYAAIISNSLLHHLHNPAVLWETVARYADDDTLIYVADLRRPANMAEARQQVEDYAAGEPELLKRDFYHSLLAAFEPQEVMAQLAAAGLAGLSVDILSDRHLVVYGTTGGP